MNGDIVSDSGMRPMNFNTKWGKLIRSVTEIGSGVTSSSGPIPRSSIKRYNYSSQFNYSNSSYSQPNFSTVRNKKNLNASLEDCNIQEAIVTDSPSGWKDMLDLPENSRYVDVESDDDEFFPKPPPTPRSMQSFVSEPRWRSNMKKSFSDPGLKFMKDDHYFGPTKMIRFRRHSVSDLNLNRTIGLEGMFQIEHPEYLSPPQKRVGANVTDSPGGWRNVNIGNADEEFFSESPSPPRSNNMQRFVSEPRWRSNMQKPLFSESRLRSKKDHYFTGRLTQKSQSRHRFGSDDEEIFVEPPSPPRSNSMQRFVSEPRWRSNMQKSVFSESRLRSKKDHYFSTGLTQKSRSRHRFVFEDEEGMETQLFSLRKKPVIEVEEREEEAVLRDERDAEMPMDMVLEEEGYMRDCICYCSLFPADYEFTRDTLVWSWNAAGFINSKQHGKMDQVAAGCFDRFIRSNYIVPIGYDHSGDQMRYKLASNYKNLDIEQSSVPSYKKGLDTDMDVAKLEHLSLISDWINDQTTEILRKCIQLKTLLLHQCSHSSKLEKLLDALFLELKLLKVLDLSRTNIEELPSSVENLKELRYLDMSETPIRRLPESIQSLEHLETLILLGCLNLCGLPKCMYKLISLKHLVLDIARMLQSMPMGIGKLTNLQTLSAFLVGTKDGNCIAELRNLNNLKGSLCIVKLENIPNKEESRKALLSNKKHLDKVEYVWSDFQDARATIEEEILEHLQPHFGLQELKIVSYSGGVLPSWISDPSYSQLISITLHGCRYCEILPSLGALPLLKILDIIDMDGVVDIDSLFCRQQTNRNYKNAFPQLEKLSLDGMSSLEIWRGVRDGDFRNLQQLVIKYCPKLIGLPSLSHLSSLGHLEISYCPDLPCLPEGDLPTSLKCIMVKGCPIIKERCGLEQGEDWAKIVTVPSLYIDDHKIN